MKNLTIIALFLLTLVSCKDSPIPKPKAYLKLSYPVTTYHKIETKCFYDFEISNQAKFTVQQNCWAKLTYPSLKATIHLTYRKVDNNLLEVLKEVTNLTFEHAKKADAINAKPYENNLKKVYGKIFNVDGNVASNLQFHVTDSVNHVVSGALYFYSKPNYDSISPAIKYIEKDIVHLIETFEWKNN